MLIYVICLDPSFEPYDQTKMQDLKFIPFKSCIDTSFWVKLNDLKVDQYKLDESEIDIIGFLDICQPINISCLIYFDGNSFTKGLSSIHGTKLFTRGKLIIKNTLESFHNVNKKDTLNYFGQDIYNKMENNSAIEEPNMLFTFLMLCYADIKKYKYVYWIAIPSMTFPPSVTLKEPPCLLTDRLNTEQTNDLEKSYLDWLKNFKNDSNSLSYSPYYFSIIPLNDDNSFKLRPLNDSELFMNERNEFSKLPLYKRGVWLGFFDNSTIPQFSQQGECTKYYPGWLLRNLISLCKIKINKDICVISNREDNQSNYDPENNVIINIVAFKMTMASYGVVKDVEQPPSLYTISNASMCFKFEFKLDGSIYRPKYMGWEISQDGNLNPKTINLSNILDPVEIVSSSAKLNVKLMKWRALPELDLDKVFNFKCLLIGAGTLGCNVARCLLAWGITNITFVDNGTISYSNPVRQSLYTFEDALPYKGSTEDKVQSKAILAASALAKIFPKVNSKGYNFMVPSPGHPITTDCQIIPEVDLLESLIKDHDAIFLLTDSRESRWLPTVMGAIYGKVVLTTALGFDSYLVMRHGSRVSTSTNREQTDHRSADVLSRKSPTPGYRLGCYFCNDVVAPTNSTGNRALDQQCTVTRPGVSYVASGLAVEIFLSLLQHPLGIDAPAISNAGTGSDNDSNQDESIESCLGIVPHQIRGFLSTFSMFQPLTLAFDKCTACSKSILDAYQSTEKISFLSKVFNSPPSFLETFSGLTQLLSDVRPNDLMTLSSSGSESFEENPG